MNQSDKNYLTTVDQVINEIIAEMPLDDKVKTANFRTPDLGQITY